MRAVLCSFIGRSMGGWELPDCTSRAWEVGNCLIVHQEHERLGTASAAIRLYMIREHERFGTA